MPADMVSKMNEGVAGRGFRHSSHHECSLKRCRAWFDSFSGDQGFFSDGPNIFRDPFLLGVV